MKFFAFASILLLLCFDSITLVSIAVGGTVVSDNEVFESFMCDLEKHVTWPAERVAEGNGKFLVVAAVGDTVWTTELKKLWGKKTSTDKRIKIRVVDKKSLPSNSHAVIVASEDSTFMKTVVKHLKGTGTLIISKGPGFSGLGSMINFYKSTDDGATLKFELNLDALAGEKIVVSKELQKQAGIVSDK